MDKNVKNPIEVSVIMPAYNASKYLQMAIDSVINQSFLNWELLIINDGSTDDTSSIIQYNIDRDNRIRGHYQENGKQGKARNLGIKSANGSYIAFLDADDIWLPNKLEVQLCEIKAKKVDLVFSDAFIFQDYNVPDRSNKINTLNTVLKGTESLQLFLKANRIPILTVLIKKDNLMQVNYFNENFEVQLAEDYHLWLKLLINNSIFYGSEKILASYRVHDMAATKEDKLASDQILEVFYDLINNYPDYKPIITRELKNKLKKRYNGCNQSKSELNKIIDNNCRYLNRQYLSVFYKCLNLFFGPRITKKFLNHLLNA